MTKDNKESKAASSGGGYRIEVRMTAGAAPIIAYYRANGTPVILADQWIEWPITMDCFAFTPSTKDAPIRPVIASWDEERMRQYNMMSKHVAEACIACLKTEFDISHPFMVGAGKVEFRLAKYRFETSARWWRVGDGHDEG